MAEAVRFHFDPRCPWCYQTARWMRRLEDLGEVTVTWAVFSLTIANDDAAGRGTDDRSAAPALRTALALRESHGNAAVGRFYMSLGSSIHMRKQSADDDAVIDAALADAGADASVRERAMADPNTWAAVQAEHDALVREKQAFGVPTIVLDGGDGPAIFGPVVSDLPDDVEARELWRHVSWLMRHDSFSELKRERPRKPNFGVQTQAA